MVSLVVMGVSGCGKSSLAQAVAAALGLPLIEGDDHHSAENLRRMREGIALTDADRQGWLAQLAALLAARPQGAVLSCSALKRAYREQLRAAAPGLRFAFLQITPALAQERVAARAAKHFFASSLVDSQFAALQPPTGEAGVLTLDATLPLHQLQQQVLAWLQPEVAR
jgi:gluconokinase